MNPSNSSEQTNLILVYCLLSARKIETANTQEFPQMVFKWRVRQEFITREYATVNMPRWTSKIINEV